MDAEFLDSMTKRVGMKVQDLRGAILTLDFAPRLSKSREDMVSLDLIQSWHR